ncbi:MAG: ABC transporter substrate-binding protein [Ectothiorhodospiraceae bacterium]
MSLVLGLALSSAVAADDTVTIAGGNYLGDLPTLVAEERELFRQQGLNAQVRYGATGAENLARLRAGTADFALMALTPLALDLLADGSPGGGDDPVILANLVHASTFNRVVVPADSPLQKPADLAGATIAVAHGTNAEVVWDLFLAIHALDPDRISVRDSAPADIGEALEHGHVDAALVWEPWRARLRERVTGGVRTIPGNTAYAGKWLLVARRDVATQEPERVRALLTAYGQAVDFAKREPTEALALYAEHAGVSAEALAPAWDALDYELSLDWSVVAALQQHIAWARRRPGTLIADAEPSVLDLLAPAALSSLRPRAVGLPASMNSGESP